MHPSQPKELYQVTFDPPEEEVMFRSSTRNVKLGKQINSSNFSEKLYMHCMSLATASHSIRKYCTYEKRTTMISVRGIIVNCLPMLSLWRETQVWSNHIEISKLPFTPSMEPLMTCWAATSYTWRVVVVGPNTLSVKSKDKLHIISSNHLNISSKLFLF